ncbi:MAG: peroxidase-related enzyme [Actinobacteria bacterium]|nr:peroxidase-related enzyme [Actinomycetota bacterium]
MRLAVLDHGQRRAAKTFLNFTSFVGRRPADDVLKTLLYRPEVLGRAFTALVRDIMRGPSPWTVGERELMAAIVSRTNACTFCTGIHSYVATLRIGADVAPGALDDWRALDLTPAVRATTELLVRLTDAPDEVTRADVDKVRAEGVSDKAIADAIHVAFVFNLINRLANAFEFTWETDDARMKDAKVLDRMGYRLPGFLMK